MSHKAKRYFVICWKMGETGDHCVERDNTSLKRQISHAINHLEM
jgi:hypothetical protein